MNLKGNLLQGYWRSQSQTDSSNSYVRIYEKGQPQALDVLHLVDSHGEFAIRGRSDSTGVLGVLGYFDSLRGALGVYGQADTGEISAWGVMGVCGEENYGILGAENVGVAGDAVSDVGVFIGGGGENNEVNSKWSGIFSGKDNIAGRGTTDYGIFIGGGESNEARLDYSTISGGYDNTIGAVYSTIGGGYKNSTTSTYTTISGGGENTISNDCEGATISGGKLNSINRFYATISGGYSNIDSACYSTIGGGKNNKIASCVDSFQTIAGGEGNHVGGNHSTIGGGNSNLINKLGRLSTICGGDDNEISGDWSTICGGSSNQILAFGSGSTKADYAGILGGRENKIQSNVGLSHYAHTRYTSILGGYSNEISATGYERSTDCSIIIGGFGNTIKAETDEENLTAMYSVILGGYSNEILNADFSLAFGNDVSIDEDYVTVFYNSELDGKVGINEESPDEALHVVGTAKIEDVLWLVPRGDEPFTTGGVEKEGIMYFDSDDHKLYIWTYDGGDWDWRAVAFE